MSDRVRRALGDRIWLVLGGGALKGLAHVGAWRAIQETELEIQGIVGTSTGALVGACIGGGMSWGQLQEIARELERSDIIRINRRAVWINGIKSSSVFRGETLREYIDSVVPVGDWEHLIPPVQMNAVNLRTGESEWFGPDARTDMPLMEAVYASAALPVMYPPAELDGEFYVDGGTREALPLDRAVELGATGIVAVDAGAGAEDDPEEVVGQGMIAIHQRVFSIMSGRERRERVSAFDRIPLLFVRPDLAGHSSFDFDAIDYFLDEGYKATKEALEKGEVRGGS